MLLHSIQVGAVRPYVVGGRKVHSAIHKTPCSGAVPVGRLGLAGDEQADPTVHGGLEKAIYAYPIEHYPFWDGLRAQAGLGALAPGSMGENLSLRGLLEDQVWVGDRLVFAHCVLRVTQPREPCFKFNMALGFPTALREMVRSGFCGFYLAVEQDASLQAGASFTLEPGPRQVSIPARFQARRRAA